MPPGCDSSFSSSVQLGAVAKAGAGDVMDKTGGNVPDEGMDTSPLSYEEFTAREHFHFFTADLTDVQHAFIQKFSDTGFPGDWDMRGMLSRMLAKDPHNSHLLGFNIVKLHALVHLRRREIPGFLYDDYKHLSPDMLDGVFVDFVARSVK